MLNPNPLARHKYQRSFTVLLLDEQLNLINEKKFTTNKFLFDHDIITKDGLFLAINNPFNSMQYKDSLTFEKINFE